MIVQTKRKFVISIDEDEAEEFLDDASALQTKVREHLRPNGNHAGAAAHHAPVAHAVPPSLTGKRGKKAGSRAGHHAGAGPKASGKGTRRTLKKTPCPECGKELPGHWLVRHRQKEHGVVPTVEVASAE